MVCTVGWYIDNINYNELALVCSRMYAVVLRYMHVEVSG